MIQRKQTLYLLISAIFAFSYLFASPMISEITGTIKDSDKVETLMISYTATEFAGAGSEAEVLNAKNSYLVFTLVVIGAVSFICIFLYKQRKLQLRLASYLLMFDLLLIFLIFYQTNLGVKVFEESDTHWKIAAFMPIILPLLHFFALRGIVHDIKLLKSVDRLR